MAAPEFVQTTPEVGAELVIHLAGGAGTVRGKLVDFTHGNHGVVIDRRRAGAQSDEKALAIIPWTAITQLCFDRVVEEGF